MNKLLFFLLFPLPVFGASLTVPGILNVLVPGGAVPEYNVKVYGAIGNGSADDTAAIQSAIDACDNGDGGTVLFPNGTYKITGTNGLIVANANLSHGGQHYISLKGESAAQTVISYAGPTNGFAIVLNSDKYVSIDNMSINRSGAVGTTVGLILTGVNSGTQSNGGYIRNVLFSGWHACISTGPGSGFTSGYAGTASEWVFDSVTFGSSDIGFANSDFNGLDFMFRMLQCSNVGTNVWAATAGVTIDGGSFSGCGTGFYCRNGGLFSIRNVRSETQTGPFVDANQPVLIEQCLVAGMIGSATNTAISISGGAGRIISCQIQGHIVASNVGSLDIEDTGVWDTQVSRLSGSNGSINFLRNYQTDGTSTRVSNFQDQVQITGPSTGTTTNLLDVSSGGTNYLSIRKDGYTFLTPSGRIYFGTNTSAGDVIRDLGAEIGFQKGDLSAYIQGDFSKILFPGAVYITHDGVDGIIRFTAASGATFNRMEFGGTTASFPSLKRSTTGLISRLADDSADTWHQSSQFIISGTTNQVIFGATNNITPGNSTTPSKWISVQVQGESTVYALPLYQ